LKPVYMYTSTYTIPVSSSASSTRTRIETPRLLYSHCSCKELRALHPREQGLKRFPSAWISGAIVELRALHPREQGLKLTVQYLSSTYDYFERFIHENKD